MKIALKDRSLFGNDAGEDEVEAVLMSYFVERPEFADFLDPTVAMQFVRGRKGTGKSALLVRFAHDRRTLHHHVRPLVIQKVPGDLINLKEPPGTDNPVAHENYWLQVICSAVNMELAKEVGFAWSDDQISLVESAELTGFKARGLINGLLARLIAKVAVGGIELTHTPKPAVNQGELLARLRQDEQLRRPVWFLLDDIDAHYQNTPRQKISIATFFSACRRLTNELEDFGVRATIRSDVYAGLTDAEHLDKVDQYITDIGWSAGQQESILTHRILAYVKRNYPGSEIAKTWTATERADELVGLVFSRRMKWGSSSAPAAHVLRILAGGRPRWLTQLCRMAAAKAVEEKRDLIAFHHVRDSMAAFGRNRLADLYKEHQFQFAELKALIESFSGSARSYSTEALLHAIRTRYLQKRSSDSMPLVDGIPYHSERQLARLLFKMGFVNGFREDARERGVPDFVNFEQRPDLLEVETNLDDGMIWQIQPAYRNALNISV